MGPLAVTVLHVWHVRAAGERQRRRYLADWGNINSWSPGQVCEYLMTHTVVALCKRQRDIEWELAGSTLVFVWRGPGTREERTTEIVEELLAHGWSRIAAAAIAHMLADALEQGACVHDAAAWLRSTVVLIAYAALRRRTSKPCA